MVDHSFDNAVNAFTRINTLGVKLKKEDIESAQVAARHTGFVANEVGPFLEKVRRQGFARLNVMHLFRACEFIARPDGRNRTPLHEFNRKDVHAAWSRTTRATEEALGLVRSELGLVNMEILWSGAFLVPVIALCAITRPRTRDARGIVGWLSIAALLHRYSKSTESALDQDLRACRVGDAIGGLLTNVRREEGDIIAFPDDFGGALNDKSALFAMYVACYHRGLKDLFSGARVLLQSNVHRHHILPKAQFPERNALPAGHLHREYRLHNRARQYFCRSKCTRGILGKTPDKGARRPNAFRPIPLCGVSIGLRSFGQPAENCWHRRSMSIFVLHCRIGAWKPLAE